MLCFLMNASLFLDLNDQLLVWKRSGLKWPAKKKWSVTRSRGANLNSCWMGPATVRSLSAEPTPHSVAWASEETLDILRSKASGFQLFVALSHSVGL